MNINFQKALKYIDLGSYNKAVDSLDAAIKEETEAGNLSEATQYKCVLGELYAQLDMQPQATAAFEAVMEYCDESHLLSKQRDIAQTYLQAYQSGTIDKLLDAQAAAANGTARKVKRPADMPIVPKPVQNKSFISRQMNKKHR